jgi:hypothetical protein
MKHGTDVRVEAQAPGNALHLNIFKQEVAAGECHTYDFAGELTEWKRRWSKITWPMMGIRLFAPTARGRIAHALGPALRRGLKRVPGMTAFVARLRGEHSPRRGGDGPTSVKRADQEPKVASPQATSEMLNHQKRGDEE